MWLAVVFSEDIYHREAEDFSSGFRVTMEVNSLCFLALIVPNGEVFRKLKVNIFATWKLKSDNFPGLYTGYIQDMCRKFYPMNREYI